jgi:hypothetical protein
MYDPTPLVSQTGLHWIRGLADNLDPFFFASRNHNMLMPVLFAKFKKNMSCIFDKITPRVARWFIFQPKIPIRVNFVGPYIANVDI